MIDFYSQIKWVHVAAVLASGTIFLLRGLAVQGNARWPMAAPHPLGPLWALVR